MFRNLKPDRGLCLGVPSANSPSGVGFSATARRIPHRAMLAAIAMTLLSAAIVISYAVLLPRDNLSSSAPALGAVLLASTLSSIAGFAFSAICGVMLLHMMSDPLQVVETMMVCSIAIQSLSVTALWRDIEWRELLTFLAGGTIGLPLGVWLLLNLGHAGFQRSGWHASDCICGLRVAQTTCHDQVRQQPDGRIRRVSRRNNRWIGWLSRRHGDDLVWHARLGQAAPARSLPTVHPGHAGTWRFC